MTLDDRLAQVQVEERFRNDGPAIAEGSYLDPLAGEASFSDVSRWLGFASSRSARRRIILLSDGMPPSASRLPSGSPTRPRRGSGWPGSSRSASDTT